MPVRIFLVDDHTIFREALRTLIEMHAGMEVVGEAGTGRKAVKMALGLRPDIVIMDVSMPTINGIDATREIIAAVPRIKVIGLSIHTDVKFVSAMLEAGASAYLLKDCAFEELIDAIRAVAENGRYLSAKISDVVVKSRSGRTPFRNQPRKSELSRREREVLQDWVSGMKAEASASRLHVSVRTIDTYRRNIRQKLGIHNLPDLVRYALRQGLATLEEPREDGPDTAGHTASLQDA